MGWDVGLVHGIIILAIRNNNKKDDAMQPFYMKVKQVSCSLEVKHWALEGSDHLFNDLTLDIL
jgi:hypothetical protein